jgi:uncharacterized protein (DUF1501 family)
MTMNRRHFIFAGASLTVLPELCFAQQQQAPQSLALTLPASAGGAASSTSLAQNKKRLILIELKGANDGLNTLVPYTDPAYYTARPVIGLKPEQVIALNAQVGLHQAMAPLMDLWKDRHMAIVQGMGYDNPNLSHFRSIEIWDAASDSDQYRDEGWLSRAFAQQATDSAAGSVSDGAVVGNGDLGPMRNAQRVLSLQNIDTFLRQSRLADPEGQAGNRSALKHLLGLERNISAAAVNLKPVVPFKTDFPAHGIGQAAKTALHVMSHGVNTVRISQASYDTHVNQLGAHQTLLAQLSETVLALSKGLKELGQWDNTLIATYAEFGRRVRENASAGTDHGTANVHFVFGGAVKGGLYGHMPSLTVLSGDGNLIHTLDYRQYYATLLHGMGLQAKQREQVLAKAYQPLNFI